MIGGFVGCGGMFDVIADFVICVSWGDCGILLSERGLVIGLILSAILRV